MSVRQHKYEKAKNLDVGRIIYHYDESISAMVEDTYDLKYSGKGFTYRDLLAKTQERYWTLPPPCVIIDRRNEPDNTVVLKVLLIRNDSNKSAIAYMVPLKHEPKKPEEHCKKDWAHGHVELTANSWPWDDQKVVCALKRMRSSVTASRSSK